MGPLILQFYSLLRGPADSRVPECDLARVLLARGITGRLTLLDAVTNAPRTIIDIEGAAKLSVRENSREEPRFIKWKPFEI
jgi:hypothetical protein